MVNRLVEWLRALLGAQGSSSVARERLRLVLLSDHLALAPDVIESLRRDLLDVISRYVEVDEAHSDVSFKHNDGGIAMLANIPILSLREREKPPGPRPPHSAHEEAVSCAPVSANGSATPGAADDGTRPTRKRRRRKAPGASQVAPAR